MKYNVLLFFLSALCARSAQAEIFTFDTPAKWQTWDLPRGIVQIDGQGRLELVKFRRQINAAADAPLFTHPTQQRGDVQGGIWRVGSNVAAGQNIIDGDTETYWQPDEADVLVDWSIDIDLGRPVLAREIKLRFPDVEGAKPFTQFSVFVSTGSRIQSQDDVFRYRKVFQTTIPNAQTEINVPLLGSALDTTRVIDSDLGFDLTAEQDFQVVRFVRIAAEEKSAAAALAEVEIVSAGDNVSLGVIERGGSFMHGLLARDPQNMFDGNMDSFAVIVTSGGSKGGWREGGMWWQVDLGALFWVDELFMYFQNRGEALSSFLFEGLHHGRGFNLLFSDGQLTTGGDLDFELLFREEMAINAPSVQERNVRHLRYLFAPRKIRYIFWHGHEDNGWFSKPMEFMIFSPGHPAQMIMRSDFIDLGQLSGDGRAKAIKNLSWDAELPPDTKLQLSSRSGNMLDEVYTFFDRTGAETTELKWTNSPKVLRGAVDTTVVAGGDWGGWSNFYQISGEQFQSDTPRRFVQLELTLSTENPEVAPALNALSIEFEDALVQRAVGRVLPRLAEVNAETRFTYALWPTSDALDSGFDRLRLALPGEFDPAELQLRIGGQPTQPVAMEQDGDSLLVIVLPDRVRQDSLELEFTTRVLSYATVFRAELGDSERPDLWQSVEDVERQAQIVFLPELAGRDKLITGLNIAPAAFTPNGDGINDEVSIRFVVLKLTESSPRVHILDLAGHNIAELPVADAADVQEYRWDGRDLAGDRVPPGVYLCKIDLGAASGKDEELRTIAVSY